VTIVAGRGAARRRLAFDFVVESDRAQLGEIVQRCGTDDCGQTSQRRGPRRCRRRSTDRATQRETVIRIRP